MERQGEPRGSLETHLAAERARQRRPDRLAPAPGVDPIPMNASAARARTANKTSAARIFAKRRRDKRCDGSGRCAAILVEVASSPTGVAGIVRSAQR